MALLSKNKEKEILLEVKNLKQYFPITTGFGKTTPLKAVDDVSFKIYKGETLGLVGESGCGKTTTGRTIMQLYKKTDGDIKFNGEHVETKEQIKDFKIKTSMVFQDPYSSLDPRMTVGDIIAEPLDVHHLYSSVKERQNKIEKLMSLVGLSSEHATRYAHEFSGGQRQRIGIARALATDPEFIICDEPVSALDVSIQAQIINTFEDLQKNLGLTYLFIAHDILVVKHISDRIAVMYLGNVVELADSEAIFAGPLHPYTEALLNAIPRTDVDSDQVLSILEGDVPSAVNPPDGCRFHTRCKYVMDRCLHFEPELQDMGNGHFVACHLMDMDLEERERYMAERNAEELAKQIKEDVIFHEIIEENY